MPKISIIMPVYNARLTVGRMIDSIIAQTFEDWELIAVDDGSSDGSGPILDDYAAKDIRIKVVHKPNGGVASSRQAGIDLASGEFTIHADSDDWVESEMLTDMLAVAVKEDADIVVADFFTDSASSSTLSVQNPHGTEPIDLLRGLYAKGLFGGLWHKLIKKSVYDKARAKFVAGINYCEDLLILTKILLDSDLKIAYIPKAYYHYVSNGSSLTQSVNLSGFESMKRFHAEASRLLSVIPELEKAVEKFRINEFIVLFTNQIYSSPSHLRREYLAIKHLIRNNYGLRWKVGFWCIDHGFLNLAHKLIKF